jgi:GNAT superfamily N-acetyltransferase
VLLRRFRSGDEALLEKFVEGLSEESISFRFLGSGIEKHFLLKELSPRRDSFTLVAVKDGVMVGHAAYYRSGLDSAEVGLLILDGYQAKGLGTGMLERIAKAANEDGISMFEAIIGWDNTRMIKLVRTMGFPTSERVEPEMIRMRFPTSIDPVSIEEFQERWVFRPLG